LVISIGLICQTQGQFSATVTIRGTSLDPNIAGTVTFYQQNSTSNVTVTINITGITQNVNTLHGIHVHQYGDVTDEVASVTTGGHWNPTNANHSCEFTDNRHYGDMGNWVVDANGNVNQQKSLDLLTLLGANSIIGRAVVVHKLTDDCMNISSSSTRLAHGVIGIGNSTGYTNEAVNGATGTTNAICFLKPTIGSNVTATVWFQQVGGIGATTVYAMISNLNGNHGFHIHNFGDISSPAALATGEHYNPTNTTHGIPPFSPRHIGDMGNIYYYANGTAFYQYSNDQITFNGVNNIIGRGVIIHLNQDDCSNPVGNGGTRLAQCVIGMTSAVPNTNLFTNVPLTQNAAACYALYGSTASQTHSFGVQVVLNVTLTVLVEFLALLL